MHIHIIAFIIIESEYQPFKVIKQIYWKKSPFKYTKNEAADAALGMESFRIIRQVLSQWEGIHGFQFSYSNLP